MLDPGKFVAIIFGFSDSEDWITPVLVVINCCCMREIYSFFTNVALSRISAVVQWICIFFGSISNFSIQLQSFAGVRKVKTKKNVLKNIRSIKKNSRVRSNSQMIPKVVSASATANWIDPKLNLVLPSAQHRNQQSYNFEKLTSQPMR